MKAKEYNFAQGKRGAVVKPPPGTTLIRFHIDNKTLNWFRARVNQAGGGDYQTLMNEALLGYIQREDSALEDAPRHMIHEELKSTARPAV